ncbi:MAG: hypothetical protein F6K55_47010 [Moorea sp. SIO4A3]|nr:hypothetical protein [Moorena sp. SIO4A3]
MGRVSQRGSHELKLLSKHHYIRFIKAIRYRVFFPCSLFPVPCSLFPVPCSLFPTPYSLLPTP